MAYINVDEVYILDNTGLQVDMATDIPFVDAGFTDAQKEQARKNIAAGGTNPNLLMNPFFTVNQRGQSSYTGTDYTFDRWRIVASGYSVAYNNDGSIRITKTSGATGQFAQYFEWDDKTTTFTFSLMSPDGTIYTRTGDYTNTGYTAYTSPDGLVFRLYMDIHNGVLRVNIYSASTQTGTIDIKAVKLEKGTTSTIANDVAPDYGTELLKCQRYFIRINSSSLDLAHGFGFIASSATATITIPTPVTMRTAPTQANASIGNFSVRANGSSYTPSGCSVRGLTENGVTMWFTSSGMSSGQVAVLSSATVGGYIDLSADL